MTGHPRATHLVHTPVHGPRSARKSSIRSMIRQFVLEAGAHNDANNRDGCVRAPQQREQRSRFGHWPRQKEDSCAGRGSGQGTRVSAAVASPFLFFCTRPPLLCLLCPGLGSGDVAGGFGALCLLVATAHLGRLGSRAYSLPGHYSVMQRFRILPHGSRAAGFARAASQHAQDGTTRKR